MTRLLACLLLVACLGLAACADQNQQSNDRKFNGAYGGIFGGGAMQ